MESVTCQPFTLLQAASRAAIATYLLVRKVRPQSAQVKARQERGSAVDANLNKAGVELSAFTARTKTSIPASLDQLESARMSATAALWEQLIPQWTAVTKRPNPNLVKQIWTALEAESFSQASVARLDASQICDHFLWPTLDESSPNQQILLLALFIHFKYESRLLTWSTFTSAPHKLSQLFSRLLSLSLDPSSTISTRSVILNYIATAFQSLEQDIIRKECAPLVSIGIWDNLHNDQYLEKCLDEVPSRRKAWRTSKKRLESADGGGRTRMRIERGWLFSVTIDFVKRLNSNTVSRADSIYCARFLEFLTNLISQLPTRRYTIILLEDLNLTSLIRTSAMCQRRESVLLRDLLDLFQRFSAFHVDDSGDVSATKDDVSRKALLQLQSMALRHFEQKLKLEELCAYLQIRTSYPSAASIKTGNELFLQILLDKYAVSASTRSEDAASLPTDKLLYHETSLRNEQYDGVEPLAVPKLNLQYLTIDDFLWRAFKLQQAEAFYEIRKDMESIVRKMKPQQSGDGTSVQFSGFSKMALPIDKPAIVDVAPPAVSHTVSAHVRAEVVLDVSRVGDKVCAEWDGLRPGDTVFMLAVKPAEKDAQPQVNGTAHIETAKDHGIH
ncbi:hypothetical protein LTR66_016359, partial [Elasticomyces elasticus]